jgi:Protein of unknown function (DUF3887)
VDSVRDRCEYCGRPLPGQKERGRRRRYCDATCRSAARRQRESALSPAPETRKFRLTEPGRKANFDDAVETVRHFAEQLAEHLAVPTPGSPIATVAAARDLAQTTDGLLRVTVDRAREHGYTWKEIGEVLGTTRQAAFQRFGRPVDPRTGAAMSEGILPDAADRATTLLADVVEGRYQAARRDFNDEMVARLDEGRLAAAWAQLAGLVGAYQQMGQSNAFQAGDYTVVQVPLYFEAGDITGRVSYGRDGRVAGLHFVPLPDRAARPR